MFRPPAFCRICNVALQKSQRNHSSMSGWSAEIPQFGQTTPRHGPCDRDVSGTLHLLCRSSGNLATDGDAAVRFVVPRTEPLFSTWRLEYNLPIRLGSVMSIWVTMAEVTIPLQDQEFIRTLFGPRDAYLRLVRDHIGVDMILRGSELRLCGSLEQVNRGRDVMNELCDIVKHKRTLPEADVRRVLDLQPPTATDSGLVVDLRDSSRRIQPRTAGQEAYVRAILENELVFCCGPAGCGKTYLAVALAIEALRHERVRKIVLVRPAVEAGEKLGYLPGDMLAKVNPFLRPLLDALNDMLTFEQVRRYMETDVVEVVPLAFMRGRTLNDTFIILDEGQNTTTTQMKMFLTRMGEHSRIVVTGDVTQVDLPSDLSSGLTDAMRRLRSIPGIGMVELTGEDIVRHQLVRQIVRAYDQS